jgi:hypothetical protein
MGQLGVLSVEMVLFVKTVCLWNIQESACYNPILYAHERDIVTLNIPLDGIDMVD